MRNANLAALFAIPGVLAAPACKLDPSNNPGAGGPPTSNRTGPKGNITIDMPQLYPENADYDVGRNVLYMSALYKSTIVAYDTRLEAVTNEMRIEGLSGNKTLHSSGVRMDGKDKLSFLINAGDAFSQDPKVQSVKGGNFLIKWDLAQNKSLWQADLSAHTNQEFGGFQDIQHHGDNTFVLGTFPSSILRISADGQKIDTWYRDTSPEAATNKSGFTGIVAVGDEFFVTDAKDKQLYRLDATTDKPEPKLVPRCDGQSGPVVEDALDGLYAPPTYKNTVFLSSDNVKGTTVLKAKDDKWTCVDSVGTIPNALIADNGFTTATVQMGPSIYSVHEYFLDITKAPAGSLAGDRSKFTFVDITDAVQQKVPAPAKAPKPSTELEPPLVDTPSTELEPPVFDTPSTELQPPTQPDTDKTPETVTPGPGFDDPFGDKPADN